MSDNESKRDNLLQPFENKDIKRAVADTYHQHLLSLMNISTSCAVGIAHMPPGLVAQIAPAAFAIIVRSITSISITYIILKRHGYTTPLL